MTKGLSAGEAVEVKKSLTHERRDWAGTRQTSGGSLTREEGGKVKGREGDAPLGDAFTARSHPITTLDSQHRPDTHTTNTPDRRTRSSTQHRETCPTQPGPDAEKNDHSARRKYKENKAVTSRTGEREKKKRSPPTGSSGHQLAEEAENLGRCRASQSTDCFQQRCVARAVADAPMRGSALWQRRHASKRLSARRHARATAKTALPHRVTRSGLEEGAHLDLTPCESMKSRAKKIFHGSTNRTGRIHEKARRTQQQWPL